MGVPTSEVGYTAAMSGRVDHEVHKDMWWGYWTKKKKKEKYYTCTYNSLPEDEFLGPKHVEDITKIKRKILI